MKTHLETLHKKYPDDENINSYNHITWRLVDVYYLSLSEAENIHLRYHTQS